MRRRNFVCRGLLPVAVGFIALTAAMRPLAAAPSSEPWARWLTYDPAATALIDHGEWDRFLKTYVRQGKDGIARLAYGEVTPAHRAALAAYIDRLADIAISRFARDEQLAYWINLYNALTIRTVLEHYPVQSIRDIRISPGLFALGPWGSKLVAVEGEGLSLDDIEHRILRPIWRDPRIHYGVNCAALGCPDLAQEAYRADNIERLLEAGARAYVNHSRGVRVESGRLRVSSIYVWFGQDFSDSESGVIAHLRRYAAPALAAALGDAARIDGHDYDWALNDAAR